ncbi:MAG TPA: DUF4142 domain-containing protein [Terracidiphilus sp.]|nr:DUF4142 domain-containing protein [Terracidiphilus sp.]
MAKSRISKRILICSAAAILTSVPLMAQMQSGGQQPSMPQQQQQPQGSMGNPGVNGPVNTAAPPDYAAQAFVSQAIEGDNAEVQLGQIAQQKGQTADVKEFGQKMVADHTQINDKLMKPVAKQLGISVPKGTSKKEKKEIAKLQGMSGKQFDTAYIQMMVKDHEKDLKDYKDEVESAQNPTVKQAAQEGETVIQKHLQLIEQIAKENNVPIPGKEMSSLK